MDLRLNQYLKVTRKAARLTQAEVAERMGLGSSQYVSNVERGNCPPSLRMLQVAASSFADPEEIIRLYVGDLESQMRKNLKKKAVLNS